ncbi:vacuolar protein sorting-associated protein 62 [Artemisia annua]|uniref:Vacuolar protein sorting-associated protein 62 n=1 Tax=Artemisia annua TaxID=35608 RepID=A0A2U1PWD0_ARTAN|nr:vacuolar protein sorting-associated protein 62 [Artemisia annua]
MSSLVLLSAHLLSAFMIFHIVCNAYKPSTSFNNVDDHEEVVSPIYHHKGKGGEFAHRIIGKFEGFKAKQFKKDGYSPRPTIEEIKVMISTFAPLIYFHPEEEFFRSSVSWFFKNGARIVDPKPHVIINDGDNLPHNGSLDSAFLDLPSDQPLHDMVKNGSLTNTVAYIHAKPGVTGNYTDVVIWLYYHFNGAAKFQFGPLTFKLMKVGEHVGDWEHIRLRIDNISGSLSSIYLSQHAKGKWIPANEFEYIDGRPVVYASLHGHAFYNAPIKTIIYNAEDLLDATDKQILIRIFKSAYLRNLSLFSFNVVGPVDEAAKSDHVFDILASSLNYEIVSLDYDADSVVPPPWLDYTGRWGPRINIEWKKHARLVITLLPIPSYVKLIALGVVNKLPQELFAQECLIVDLLFFRVFLRVV